MVRGINCHSPYKHYMMFHGGCDEGGYGSIFNTTYNIECGGHHGGFWGGFGFGLGNAFGKLFNGFLGGGWGNFGFGNMFSGGWGNMWGNMWGGGSPFACSWGGGAGGGGNWWGNNSGRVGNSDTGCHCKDKETKTVEKVVDDADEAIHKEFKDKIAKLSDTDVDGAKALYNEIKAKMDKNADEHNKSISTDAYENLLKDLQKKFPHVTFDKTQPPAGSTGTTGTGVTGGAGNGTGDDTAKINAATNFDELPEYDKLSDDDKTKYTDKCKELAKAENMTPDDLKAFLSKLPDDVRVKVKASFYKEGYTNVKAEELTAEKLKKLIDVIDDSDKIDDFHNITVGTPTKSGDIWTIPMTKANGHAQVVNYVQVKVVDGEIIFHGKNNDQHYVLQQDSEHKLHLMQYKYHDGYGSADVRNK